MCGVEISQLGALAHFSSLSIEKLCSLSYERRQAIFEDWQVGTPKESYLEPGERDGAAEEEAEVSAWIRENALCGD